MRPTTTIASVILVTALLAASALASPDQKINQKKEPLTVKQAKDEVQATGEGSASKEESEYLQIKAEEVGVEAGPKAEQLNISDNVQAPESVEQQSSVADEKLSSHLAQDIISPQESSFKPYSSLEPMHSLNRPSPRISGPKPAGLYGAPVAVGYRQSPPHQPRQPPSYVPLKGKLTGFNTLVSQYPHPMPGYPHHGPRHLPRGAAAGFAAFRDYVRAHAHNYKQSPVPLNPQVLPSPVPLPLPPAPASASTYHYGPGPVYSTQSKKTKVSVTKAYIPQIGHPIPASSPYPNQAGNSPGAAYSASAGSHYRPVSTSGRPEYSKDYGMVIHYPQATVYTEPMSVDQLHKLTGTGINQILQHLQYQLATGHRDETNTIQGGSKHHIGQGLSIQAKEYYAPSKSGHYVQATAAVIAGPEEHQSTQYQQVSSTNYGNLGSGYERVRQAFEASQNRPKQPLEHYEAGSGAVTNYGPGAIAETLAPVTSLIASELENLYGRQKQYPSQQQTPRYPVGSSFRYRLPGVYQSQPQPAIKQQQHRLQRLKQRLPKRGTRQLSAIRQLKRPAPVTTYQAVEFPLQQQQRLPNPYLTKPASQQQQQYLQNCQKAEQALDKQMNQLLHELQSGEEQYDSKEQQGRPINQGYPYKIMQKYQRQQQRDQPSYNKPKSSSGGYATQEGLEFVHGPNDQVGEITDLMEALRSSLELHKPTDYQQQQLGDDVKYLASALGQQPSYAIQVPVAPTAAPTASGYQQATGSLKTSSEAYQQQAHQPTQYQQIPQVTQVQPQYQHQSDFIGQVAEHYPKSLSEPIQQTYVPAKQVSDYNATPQLNQEKPHKFAVFSPNVASGPSYGLQQSQAAFEVPNQKQVTYTSSHIINHLVPVATGVAAATVPVAAEPAPLYPDQSAPAQLASPAPLASVEPQFQQQHIQYQQHQHQQQQYQQQLAQYQQQQQQPLNSYVDSLAAEYQEILRQPPVLLQPGQQFQQTQQQQVELQEQTFQINNSTSSSTSNSLQQQQQQQQLNLTTQPPIQQQVISTGGFKGIQQELDGQF